MATTMVIDTIRNPVDSSYAIACLEVWGGNKATRTSVSLPGLAGWVCSDPFEGSSGGDVYYLSDCNVGALSRVVLADVSGHGPAVSDVAARLKSQMYRHINTWDQSEFVRDLGDTLRQDERSTNYATAVILSYLPAKHQLTLTNAGHPEPLWYHAADDRWELLSDEVASTAGELSGLPLGLIAGTSYRQNTFSLGSKDIVILYTDSLIERPTPSAEPVGRKRLLEVARQVSTDFPAGIGESLLRHLRGTAATSTRADDETIIVLQRSDAAESCAGTRGPDRLDHTGGGVHPGA